MPSPGDLLLPAKVYGKPALGWLLAGGAVVVVLDAARTLLSVGGLNRRAAAVARGRNIGIYGHIPRPILMGLGLLVCGAAVVLQSPVGFWIAAPLTAVALAAWALGWDSPRLRRIASASSLAVLPANDESRPSLLERFRVLWLVVLPWLALFAYSTAGGVPPGAIKFAFGWEDQLPVWEWTEIIYGSTFPLIAAAPWIARTRADLRRFMIHAWIAMAIVFPIYWIFPSLAPRRHTEATGVLSQLLLLERDSNPPTAAFPSFHVIWSVLAGQLMRPRWLGWLYAVLVGVTCITTGMHYLPDIFAGFVASFLFIALPGWWTGATGSRRREWVAFGCWMLFTAAFVWRLEALGEPAWFSAGVAVVLAGSGAFATSRYSPVAP